MRGTRRVLLVAAAVLVAGQGAAIFLPEHLAPVVVARDVIPFLVPLVAALAAFVAAGSSRIEERSFWTFIGLGALAWALGDIGFSVYDLLDFDPSGRLTLADAGYLLLIPLWGAALIVHPSRSRRGIDRLGTSIDGLVVFSFAATLTTTYVLVPSLRDATDLAGAIVNVVYPIGDLALIAVLVSIMARAAHGLRTGDLAIAAAAAVFALGDILYVRMSLTGSYETGHPVDLTWSLAFLCVAFAAGRTLSVRTRSDEERSPLPLLALAGMVAVLCLAVIVAFTRLNDVALLAGAEITAMLVVSRLFILLLDRATLVRSLDEKVLELEDAHAARERFIATVSHDLRSPLTAIEGFAQLLQNPAFNADPERVVEMASTIERNARHLTNMSEDLLCAGQFATGNPPHLDLRTVNLRDVIVQTMNDLGRSDRVNVGGSPFVHAVADERRLRQIVTNLVDNAFKHSGSADIRVYAGESAEGSTIEVSDAGVGIDPERMTRIFDPFVSDRMNASSVGLGLYVVGNLVSAMGGRLSVTSVVGGGTTFTVVLPHADTPAQAPDSEAS
jgi:signal transduction histidine kinase